MGEQRTAAGLAHSQGGGLTAVAVSASRASDTTRMYTSSATTSSREGQGAARH